MSARKPTNEELVLRVIDGNHDALNQLYNQNLGLIKDSCKKAFAKCDLPKEVDFEDLNQEAALCFFESAPKYNPDLGFRFSTFISNCIYNHMIDYIVKSIKVSSKEIHIIQKSNDGSGEKTNGLLEDYWQKRLHIFCISAEKAYFIDYFRETIKNALDLLSPRQLKLISFRFGLGGEEEYCFHHTIEETSEHFGISIRDVRGIQETSLRKMRRYCHQRLDYIVRENDINISEVIGFIGENYTGSLPYIPEDILTGEYQFDEPNTDETSDSFDDYEGGYGDDYDSDYYDYADD